MKKGIRFVYGIDLGDRSSQVCELDRRTGEVGLDLKVKTTREQFDALFGTIPQSRIVMECSGSSPWVSRLARAHGHDVIVADSRKLRAIWDTPQKNDRRDALLLAQLGGSATPLLHGVHHRGETAQRRLSVIRARDLVVQARTKLINGARGIVKTDGRRLPSCSADAFHRKVSASIPAELEPALEPLVAVVAAMNEQIRAYDHEIERLCRTEYEVAARLTTVPGVGALSALAFVLVIDDPQRFRRSRDVGAYVGITPRRDQSGETDKQLPITKSGDTLLRRLLVQCAHHVLGPRGKDSRMRTWGLALAARGGRNAKKRAVVAVARKLAVLLHSMWVSGERYDPARGGTEAKAA